MSVNEELRKLVLAGLGAASLAAEKTGETLESLVKRGEEALAQGKDLNERLRHEIRQTINEEEKPTGGVTGKEAVMASLDQLSPEERKEIAKKLRQMEKESSTNE